MAFHDSVLEKIWMSQGSAFVLFVGEVFESAGRPGVDDGPVYEQEVLLEIEGAQVEGDIGDLPAGIYEGVLEAGETLYEDRVVLPGDFPGRVSVLLLTDGNEIISVSGQHAKIEAQGEAVQVWEICSDWDEPEDFQV